MVRRGLPGKVKVPHQAVRVAGVWALCLQQCAAADAASGVGDSEGAAQQQAACHCVQHCMIVVSKVSWNVFDDHNQAWQAGPPLPHFGHRQGIGPMQRWGSFK